MRSGNSFAAAVVGSAADAASASAVSSAAAGSSTLSTMWTTPLRASRSALVTAAPSTVTAPLSAARVNVSPARVSTAPGATSAAMTVPATTWCRSTCASCSGSAARAARASAGRAAKASSLGAKTVAAGCLRSASTKPASARAWLSALSDGSAAMTPATVSSLPVTWNARMMSCSPRCTGKSGPSGNSYSPATPASVWSMA